jgi:transcriptional regulator with XRE-family HTH domain
LEYIVLQEQVVVNQRRLREIIVLTPSQVRMARAALGWGVRDLGKRAGISPNTVSRFENGFGAMVETLVRIQETLEGAGIVFISADQQGGPGVRLRDVPPSKGKRRR